MAFTRSHGLVNRREVLKGGAALWSALQVSPLHAATGAAAFQTEIDLMRQPDMARVFLGEARDSVHALVRIGDGWAAAGLDLHYAVGEQGGTVSVSAQDVRLRRVHLRWKVRLSEDLSVLGDAWERSYGDLAWLPLQAERPLPWYCLLHDGTRTQGLGAETGAAAFAFWQVDDDGVSLWLDTRNGGNGVNLRHRTLTLATVVTCTSGAGESAFRTAQRLCRAMAAKVVLPAKRGSYAVNALYGSNDWYYAYGKNTAAGILRDADLIRELSPEGDARPFTVIDDGYQDAKRFPDMQRLAEELRRKEVSPGVWIRPLRASRAAQSSWLLPAARFGERRQRAGDLAFDPTVPEARRAILDVVREACGWGYGLIKHDFTSYELLGQWGSEMGASPTLDGWNLADQTKTNAEVLTELYKDIRKTAGDDRIVIGCNTVGHLAAGIFDAQRTGDDVSGREWERTRRMGVNTLAYRLPQHRSFFALDADCVPITREIPWSFTEKWLNAVAASGSVLLISPEPGAVGREQKRAIRAAFRQCVSSRQGSEPEDWMNTRTPSEWISGSARKRYEWLPREGASPFSV